MSRRPSQSRSRAWATTESGQQAGVAHAECQPGFEPERLGPDQAGLVEPQLCPPIGGFAAVGLGERHSVEPDARAGGIEGHGGDVAFAEPGLQHEVAAELLRVHADARVPAVQVDLAVGFLTVEIEEHVQVRTAGEQRESGIFREVAVVDREIGQRRFGQADPGSHVEGRVGSARSLQAGRAGLHA
ncbi:MAG: hypothetical protein KFB96_08150 [Thiocapsa sp.]|uniref:hypothetical protein n=1 Tax=Thiocapsa sp. TaxID=2024551 RepID=UPI001BD0DD34|nr:hypothetical protein [Thiocapsa sp.]QVL50391.1 MAG: hypothetical protein KFB96_08150 [Thiocapsa sp.]